MQVTRAGFIVAYSSLISCLSLSVPLPRPCRPRGHDGDAGFWRQPVVMAAGRVPQSYVILSVLLHWGQQRFRRASSELHLHA